MTTNTGSEPGIRQDAIRRVAYKIWTLSATDDVGDWFDTGTLTDISVHVYGANHNGATLKILTSNEEVPAAAQANAVVADDLQGNSMSFTTSPQLEGVGPAGRWLCPKVTVGAFAGNQIIALYARKQYKG